MEQIRPPKRADGAPRPFYLCTWARPGVTPGMFLVAKLDPKENARYREFRKMHPEMVGIEISEWVNDAKGVRRWPADGKPKWSGPKYDEKYVRKRGPIVPPETYWAFLKSDLVSHATDSREKFLAYLENTFSRMTEISYGAAEDLFPGDGCYCADHLAADWGAGQLWMETSRNYAFWQTQLMFCRGAASQYGIPFHWYIASFWSGFDSNGKKFSRDGYQNADHPEGGISLSAVKRATYLTYLVGARSYEREDGGGCYKYRAGDKAGQIAPEGEMFEGFWRFCKTNPRGVPYRPVAIIVPRDRGYLRHGGKAFYDLFEYTRSDYLLDALMCVILDFRKNKAPGMAKNGVERVMANSRYGDVFDVIVPGGHRPETFRRALMKYKLAFIAGEMAFGNEDRKALDEFVKGGGRLVDVGALVDNWQGPDRSFANIVTDEYDFWSDFNVPKDAPPPYAGFERLDAAVAESVLPLHPFRVSGDIQIGFNRLDDGWLVYLVNNGGVKKFGDTVAEHSPEGARVTVGLDGFELREVCELVAGENIAVDGKTLSLTVPSGDLRVLRLIGK